MTKSMIVRAAPRVPPGLAARGITSLVDTLPPGAELDIAGDFARIFRGEIEARLFGWSQPLSARPVSPAPLSSFPSR